MSRSVDASWALYDRAAEVIPLGTQTHSKAPREALRGVEPCFIARGSGCRVWDVDGNEYIDFRCGLGPISLGYAHPAVVEAVRRQIGDGSVFSYAHPLEVEVAERLVEVVPCAESVRFLKTGGEAMAAAHRLARACTGRDLILACGYHGWINSMGRAGVPAAMGGLYRDLPWGRAAAFEAAFDELGPDRVAARLGVPAGFRGLPPAGHLDLPSPEARLAFEGECLRRGVIPYTLFYTSFSHAAADVDEALGAVEEALTVVRDRGLLATAPEHTLR